MPFQTSSIAPLSKLNKDKKLSLLKQGEYIDGLDITHIGKDENTTGAIRNQLGNTLAFTKEAVTTQNKIYRVSGYGAEGANVVRSIRFLDMNNNVWGAADHTVEGASLTATATNIQGIITSILGAITPVQTAAFTNADDFSYFDVEVTAVTNPINGYDYTLANFDNSSSLYSPLTISVIQEAYDVSLSGNLHDIGSYNLFEDLFLWSTPQISLISTLGTTITDATWNGSLIVLTTSGAHGIVAGQKFKVTGVNGNTNANGIHIAYDATDTTITIYNVIGNAAFTSSPNSTIEINLEGLGELGVAVKDNNSGEWAYTRLGRTKDWNFRRPYQLTGSHIEIHSGKKHIYWTDDFNVPRVLYYKGSYEEDGIINAKNANGQYSYDTIDLETKLIISKTNSRLAFTSQDDAGGNLTSGNKRYTYRFIGESGTGTEYADLSNPIPTYSASITEPSKIVGDEEGTLTGKANNFLLTGIIPGLFKYVELVVVEYVTLNFFTYTVRKELLGNSSEITLRHDGNETLIPLNPGDLGLPTTDYVRAKNMTSIDKRLVLSNVKTQEQYDLSEWVATFTYGLKRKTISSVKDLPNFSFGEYLDPMNVYLLTGYMMNETYRFSVKLKFKNGGWTQNYFFADITFNQSLTSTDGKRTYNDWNVAGDLGNSQMTQTYMAHAEVSNMDFDFVLPDGKRIRDVFEAISFERAECVPEVLATGALMLMQNTSGSDYRVAENYFNGTAYVESGSGGGTITITGTIVVSGEIQIIGNWVSQFTGVLTLDIVIVIGGGGEGTYTISISPVVSYNSILNETSVFVDGWVQGNKDIVIQWTPTSSLAISRMIGLFHSMDNLLGGVDLTYRAGDSILHLGQPTTPFIGSLRFADYSGNCAESTYTQISVSNNKNNSGGETVQLNPNGQSVNFINIGVNGGNIMQGYALELTSEITSPSAATDRGIYYVQYFRPLTNKYGNHDQTKYTPCGHYLSIDANVNETTETSVLGGDTFTQKWHLHSQYGGSPTGAGYGFYAQNRVNSQMRDNDNQGSSVIPGLYGQASMDLNIQAFIDATTSQGMSYNQGYSVRNQIQIHTAFDANLEQITDLPDTIVWSDIKIDGGLQDGKRVFLPLNRHYLEGAFGEIIHTENGNGELLSWQKGKFMRQYFNTRGTLSIADSSTVLIGDGSVMSRDGQTLSLIGCDNKFSILRGKSAGGNDVFLWINTELKKAVRFGYDGTRSIGDIADMQVFFANNLRWITGKDNPTEEQGLCGIWDDRHAEFIWTFRGWKEVSVWRDGFGYTTNQVVQQGTSGFEQTPDFYRCIANHTSATATNKPATGSSWQSFWSLIPKTDNNYYSLYTLVFNEFKNGFTSFCTPKPKIYFKYKDTYLSPRPIGNVSKIYEHNTGFETTWYDDGSTRQESDAYIEMVFAIDENLTKEYLALFISSEIVPYRIEFKTKTHETFVVAADIEADNEKFIVPIPMDILTSTTGLANNEDTSNLFGQWLKIKIFFEKGVPQSLMSVVLKYFPLNRTYNK